MTKRVAQIAVAIFTGIIILGITGCEDPIPTDFVQQYVVEGYLIVDEPIRGITIARSQSPIDSFDYAGSGVPDATVQITVGDRTLDLLYRTLGEGSIGEYYYPDTNEVVAPSTRYALKVMIGDGTILTGQTFTPERTAWIQAPRDTLQYPKDTLELASPDSLNLIWQSSPGIVEYLIKVQCQDTLEYGKYLTPPREEKNRRIERFFENPESSRYNDLSRWGFLQSTSVPVAWFAFKWFGRHTITVYAPDANFLNWFKQTRFGSNEFSERLGSIQGGVGVFGSAAAITQNSFILKNQP